MFPVYKMRKLRFKVAKELDFVSKLKKGNIFHLHGM